MTEKTKIFLKKEWIDIVFSVISFVFFVAFYWGISIILDMITGVISDGSDCILAIIIGYVLMIILGTNIFIQTILNIASVKNKVKSYMFFIALIADVVLLIYLIFMEGISTKEIVYILPLLLLAIVSFIIKFLIAKYYYKTLNKIKIQ